MVNLFIWEEPVDWMYMSPVARHLSGDNIFLRRTRTKANPEGLLEASTAFYKPDNVLVFRYDSFKLIRDLPGIKYQLYHGVADKGFKYLGGQILQLGMNYDFFIEAGPYYEDRMVRIGGLPQERVVALGYPKLDTFPAYRQNKVKILESLGLDPSKRTMFYAPTCREQNSIYSFLDAQFQGEILGDHLTEIIPDELNMNLIIKLHDEIPWMEERIKALNDPSIIFVKDYDSVKYTAAADVVLSDCSSIMLEAMAGDVPVIQYINNPKNFPFKDSCDLWDYTTKVHNLRELRDAIRYHHQHPRYKHRLRAHYTKEMFYNLFDAGRLVASFIELQHNRR